jgi:hypothetical protein
MRVVNTSDGLVSCKGQTVDSSISESGKPRRPIPPRRRGTSTTSDATVRRSTTVPCASSSRSALRSSLFVPSSHRVHVRGIDPIAVSDAGNGRTWVANLWTRSRSYSYSFHRRWLQPSLFLLSTSSVQSTSYHATLRCLRAPTTSSVAKSRTSTLLRVCTSPPLLSPLPASRSITIIISSPRAIFPTTSPSTDSASASACYPAVPTRLGRRGGVTFRADDAGAYERDQLPDPGDGGRVVEGEDSEWWTGWTGW